MENPFFSIITPVYNSERFLRECIDSVLNQTYSSWELILIDDGSKDNSGKICDKFASMDSRIKVIHKENKGQYDSRRRGIEIASGMYCIGLDSDDYYELDCLERVYGALKKYGCDMVVWNWNIRMDGGINKKCKPYIPPNTIYSMAEYLPKMIFATDHSLCNKAIKCEYLQKTVSKEVPTDIRMAEDYMMIIGALCMSKDVYVMEDVLYNYRHYGESVSDVQSVKYVTDMLRASEYVQEQLEKYGMLSDDVKKADSISLLDSIGYRISEAFKIGAVTLDDCQKIVSIEFYKLLAPYEKRKYFDFEKFLVLKFLRYRLYYMNRLLFWLKKIKRSIHEK
jgi:glycosyltransferase involved in cell wall biosynthesis